MRTVDFHHTPWCDLNANSGIALFMCLSVRMPLVGSLVPTPPAPTQQDLGDGRYNIMYCLTKAGDYDVRVEGPEVPTGEGVGTEGEELGGRSDGVRRGSGWGGSRGLTGGVIERMCRGA